MAAALKKLETQTYPLADELDHFTPQESFLEEMNNCPICGSTLEFEYRTEAFDNKLTEKAHCGECQIRIRDEDYNVQ